MPNSLCSKFNKYAIVALLILIFSNTSFSANPKLFFTSSDISAIQNKIVADPDLMAIWNSIYARANGYCISDSGSYIDPESTWFQDGDYGWYGRDVQGWVETIGFVYQMTGNPLYGEHGAAILCSAADYVAPAGSLLPKNIDMMRTLATGYDWLAPAMTPEQKTKIETVAKEYIEWSFSYFESSAWIPYHNFTGVAFGGTGLLALAMEDAYPTDAPVWIEDAKNHVSDWFENGFDANGAYLEGHVYMNYGMSNAIAFGHSLSLNKGIDILSHPHIQSVPYFLAMTRVPGTDVYEGRNDSSFSTFLNITIMHLCDANNDSLLRWLWDRSQLYVTPTSSGDGGYRPDYHTGGYSPLRFIWENNVTPMTDVEADLPLAEHFTQRGLVTFRSGWDPDATLFTIEASPYNFVTHNQADKGHFNFYGLGGYRWATDLGYGVDETSAHSCILVDGAGQALSAGGGRGTDGVILDYQDNQTYGYALADATSAYNINNLGEPGVVVEHALRHSVYVRPRDGKPAYAVIFDDIKKDESTHTYTWQLMSATNMEMRIDQDNPIVMPMEYIETPVGTTGTGYAIWTVDVPVAGEYSLWGRVRPGGSTISGSDSFNVRVDDQSLIDWHFDSLTSAASWLWDKVTDGVGRTAVTFNLTAGTHQIKFYTREYGAQLAAAFLTADSAATRPFTPYSTNGIYLETSQAAVTPPMVYYPPVAKMDVVMDASAPITYGYDYYGSYPRLRANCDAVNPKFISFMMPHYSTEEAPEVTFSDVENNGRRITILWSDRMDEMIWTADGIDVNIQSCSYAIPGDINEDCYVDFADLAIFAQYWMQCSDPAVPGCEQAAK